MKAKRTLAVFLVAVMLLVPFSMFVSAAGETLVSGPIKTAYTDNEYFNPQGIVINVNGKEIAYSPVDSKFKFVPGLDERLTTANAEVTGGGAPLLDENGYQVYSANVDIYYNEVKVDTVKVRVSHVWGKVQYMDNNYHGHFCMGCGIVDEVTFSKHNVAEYIPNDDGGLFIQQSESGECVDCGHIITRKIAETEKFNSIFSGNFSDLEAEILTYVSSILVGLIQFLTGFGS